MTDAQEQLKEFKRVMGSFVNTRPRDFGTPEMTNASIDRVVSALEAIRPKAEAAPAGDPPKRKDPNRMHKGGKTRDGSDSEESSEEE